MSHVIETAVKLAYRWHDGQVRKYCKLPYFVHPVMVASQVERIMFADPTWPGWPNHFSTVIAAAYLHDVVEDCGIQMHDFLDEFGSISGAEIFSLVKEVTEVSRPEMGNRTLRRGLDADHYAQASPAGQSIKLADIYDNALSIKGSDANFWKVYQREMQALVPRLTNGHRALLDLAWDAVK